MKLIVNDAVITFSAETASGVRGDHALGSAQRTCFPVTLEKSRRVPLLDLGPAAFACREPINIVWADTALEEQWRAISNLAPTPFELDGAL